MRCVYLQKKILKFNLCLLSQVSSNFSKISSYIVLPHCCFLQIANNYSYYPQLFYSSFQHGLYDDVSRVISLGPLGVDITVIFLQHSNLRSMNTGNCAWNFIQRPFIFVAFLTLHVVIIGFINIIDDLGLFFVLWWLVGAF